jgi:hypothetical protein
MKILKKFGVALLLFILGAVVGTLCDLAHVYTGVLEYPISDEYPFLIAGVQPPWVLLLMGGSTVAIAWGMLSGDRWLREGYGKVIPGFISWKHWALGFAMAIGLWAGSGLLPRGGIEADGVMFLVAGWILLLLDRTWAGLYQSAAVAVAGVIVEYLLSSRGYFNYADAVKGPWGLPSWLCWIYVAIAPSVGGIARKLLRGEDVSR